MIEQIVTGHSAQVLLINEFQKLLDKLEEILRIFFDVVEHVFCAVTGHLAEVLLINAFQKLLDKVEEILRIFFDLIEQVSCGVTGHSSTSILNK